MKMITGTFLGTGSTLYLGLGFIPKFFQMYNTNAAVTLTWEDCMWGLSTCSAGITMTGADGVEVPRTLANVAYGAQPYEGGDVMSAANANYLMLDNSDHRGDYAPPAKISAWTLGSSANKTGNFDAACAVGVVGLGSKIAIATAGAGAKWATIVGLTSTGAAANQVTLDKAMPSGAIAKITNMYTLYSAPKGAVVPRGLVIGASCTANTAYVCKFRAIGE